MLTRAAILAAPDLLEGSQVVAVPEWGGEVRVRVMSAGDRSTFENLAAKDRNLAVTAMVALTACDDAGERYFGDSDEDLAALGRKSSKVVARLFDAALAVNKLRPADTDASEKN